MIEVLEFESRDSSLIDSFSRLLLPIQESEFAQTYFERTPCVIRGKSDRSSTLLLPSDIDDIVRSSSEAIDGYLRFIREGKDLRPPVKKTGDELVKWVHGIQNEGWTLLLAHAEEFIPSIEKVTSSMSDFFGALATSGVFRSLPEQNARKYHIDLDEVFIVQISGKKHWSIGELLLEHPPRNLQQYPQFDSIDCETTVTLTSGDVLYLPAGFIHKAHTTASDSLHLLLQVCPKRVIDWMKAILDEVSSKDANLRKGILADFPTAGDRKKRLIGTILTVLQQVNEEENIFATGSTYTDRLETLKTSTGL